MLICAACRLHNMIGNHKQQPKNHWGTSEELKIAGQHSQRNHCVRTGVELYELELYELELYELELSAMLCTMRYTSVDEAVTRVSVH